MFSSAKTRIRNIFFAGILITVPLGLSVFILRFLFTWIDNLFSPSITALLIKFGHIPLNPGYRIPGIGVGSTIVLIFLVGLFTRNIIGRNVVRLYEAVLIRIPIFKNIYVGAKQVIETIGSSSAKSFNKVVMLEYPRKDIYALAFITSESRGEAKRMVGKEMTNIFLPTTPNPTSGFFLLVPEKDIIELEMSVEDGIKMIISGGLVTPPDPKDLKAINKWEGVERRVGKGDRRSGVKDRRAGGLFHNMILKTPLDRDEMVTMSRLHDGVIKVVVDIKKETAAAGAKWHSDSRDILVSDGSKPEDCWGAKIDVYTGEVVFESQINKDRPENSSVEIKNEHIREVVAKVASKYLPLI
jgi:uncharacterized membrane protein